MHLLIQLVYCQGGWQKKVKKHWFKRTSNYGSEAAYMILHVGGTLSWYK